MYGSRVRVTWLLIIGVNGLLACGNSHDHRGDDASSGGRVAASGGASGAATACDVQAPTACPTPPVTFNQLKPILDQHCVVCHAGVGEGPWALTSYEHVAAWADMIRAEMLTCGMPPPDSGIEISAADRLQILTWIRCGTPM